MALIAASSPSQVDAGSRVDSALPLKSRTATKPLSSRTGQATDPVVAAAGDIACDPQSTSFNGGAGTATACRQKYTSDVLDSSLFPSLDVALALGDTQYDDGAYTKFLGSYDLSWGRLKAVTRPVPGNHDYGTAGAAGYYQYFGSAAGDPSKGYYSFNVGTWHMIALNSNCARVGGCGLGSPQEQWLKADLASSASACVIAYWHHPRFSSGQHGNDASYDAFWRDLYSARADVVLAGHDHSYERFAPQDPDQRPDTGGIREFVVGTGGNGLYSFASLQPNSEIRIAGQFGVLKLTLRPGSYSWDFISESGSLLDTGSTECSAPATTGGNVFVGDQFERAVAAGLGSADVGGVWRVNSAARTKVENGEAVVYGWSGGGQDVQAWQDVVRQDMELLSLVRLNATNPSGGSYKARVVARAQTDARNGYYASISHTPAGAVTWQLSRIDNLGGTGSLSLGAGTLQSSGGAGTMWWVRFRVQGTTIQVRYWRDGTTEPTTWKTSVTDSYFTSGRPSFGVSTGSGLSTPFPDTGFASFAATDLSITP